MHGQIHTKDSVSAEMMLMDGPDRAEHLSDVCFWFVVDWWEVRARGVNTCPVSMVSVACWLVGAGSSGVSQHNEQIRNTT